MKKKLKTLLLFPLTFFLCLLCLNVLMVLVSCFPSSAIEDNVRKSAKIMDEDEGNFDQISERFYIFRDNYTDAIMVNYAYSIDNTDIIYSYMSGRKNYKEGQTKYSEKETPSEGKSYAINYREHYDTTRELSEFVDGDIVVSANYARYWHGYLIFLRPMLLLFNVTQIRSITFLATIILLITIGILCFKKYSKPLAFALPISLIVSGICSASIGLGTAPVFLIGLISTVILLAKKEKIKHLSIFFFIIGILTNFFDFLSVPMVAWAIPFIAYIFIVFKENEQRKSIWFWLKEFLLTIIPFVIGYGLTWVSKWLIYDFIYEENVIKNSLDQVAHRRGADGSFDMDYLKYLINYMTDDMFQYVGYGLIGIAAVFFITHRVAKIELRENYNVFPFILTAIVPYIWYYVLKNHTSVHYYFIYRHLAITITAILCAIVAPFVFTKKDKLEPAKESPKKEEKIEDKDKPKQETKKPKKAQKIKEKTS